MPKHFFWFCQYTKTFDWVVLPERSMNHTPCTLWKHLPMPTSAKTLPRPPSLTEKPHVGLFQQCFMGMLKISPVAPLVHYCDIPRIFSFFPLFHSWFHKEILFLKQNYNSQFPLLIVLFRSILLSFITHRLWQNKVNLENNFVSNCLYIFLNYNNSAWVNANRIPNWICVYTFQWKLTEKQVFSWHF